jgi:hypothetical protein
MPKLPRAPENLKLAIGIPAFGVLAALEGLLILAPAMGLSFTHWTEACGLGLCFLGAFAWFMVPHNIPGA